MILPLKHVDVKLQCSCKCNCNYMQSYSKYTTTNILERIFLLETSVYVWCYNSILKSWFNESRFNKMPQFSEQMPAPLNYFTIVNSIRFSEQKWSEGRSFVKSRLGCTTALKNCNFLKIFTHCSKCTHHDVFDLGTGIRSDFSFDGSGFTQ